MRIGVIGAGWLGGTVGRLGIEAGRQVLLSSRNPQKQQRAAAGLGPRASGGTFEEASDDPEAMQIVGQLVRDAGCYPVAVGDLAAGRRFQRGGAGFRALGLH